MATRTDEPTVDQIEDMAPVPVLVVVHHPDVHRIGRRFVLAANEELVLGRSAEVFGIGALELPSVSRNHAVVHTTLEGSSLRDSGSHNGTFVNGKAVCSHGLSPGDVIGLGPVLLLYGSSSPNSTSSFL